MNDRAGFSLGLVGTGQGAGQFAQLFAAHPLVTDVCVTDERPEQALGLVSRFGISRTYPNFEAMLASDIDAVAIFTQRWTHGPLVVQALRAGKHVYSAAPMAVSVWEVAEILGTVRETGLTYMMGETSYYNPATVYARKKNADGAFGRIFYAEGDHVHDLDLGFYEASQYGDGPEWKKTASYPPMLYPTDSVGGVLSAIGSHAVSVSCIGVRDDRGDGVFDRQVSLFDNDFSNATALFELAGGGAMRINEFRRVGYPSQCRESRFRYFGTEGSFEQLASISLWQDKNAATDVTELLATAEPIGPGDESLLHVSPARPAGLTSGLALVHDGARLPPELLGLPNGNEGSHYFLVDDFAQAVAHGMLPPVNAWEAARYTLPGITAHQSAQRGGERLRVPDFGDAPHWASIGKALTRKQRD